MRELSPGERGFLKFAVLAFFVLLPLGYFLQTPPPQTPPPRRVIPENIKARAIDLSYEAIARTPAAYTRQIVTFQGKVIQAAQDGVSYALRVNVTRGKYDSWTDTIWVDYRAASQAEPRILEGDIVQLWGEFVGIKSYKAIFGQTISIPQVIALVIEAHR
jgi:hypothetical protein